MQPSLFSFIKSVSTPALSLLGLAEPLREDDEDDPLREVDEDNDPSKYQLEQTEIQEISPSPVKQTYASIANFFSNKGDSKLTPDEAKTLVGMLKETSDGNIFEFKATPAFNDPKPLFFPVTSFNQVL